MKNVLTAVRNHIIKFVYIWVLKPMLFRIDPEVVHDRFIHMGKRLGSVSFFRTIATFAFGYTHPMLKQTIRGIHFPNPVGLAAGFDKNAELTDILPSIGFAFAELGSMTAKPYEGNPKPRLWRLPKHKSLQVYYGLKNIGVENIAEKLRKKTFAIPMGISIAKTNCKETANTREGIKDYVEGIRAVEDVGDYLTINISCPNAFGGEPFTNPQRLALLLEALKDDLKKRVVFIKLAPDLSEGTIDHLLKVVKPYAVDGFICCNLTKKNLSDAVRKARPSEKGGLSGKLVEGKALNIIRYMYKKTKGKYVFMGVGGVFTADDAYNMIRSGASLVQLITGMIYQGPQTISEINSGLVQRLKRDGFEHIAEAVGVDV